MSTQTVERTCGNCKLFHLFQVDPIQAMDVITNQAIQPGQRGCSARNTAWADTYCVTGEFVEKKTELTA